MVTGFANALNAIAHFFVNLSRELFQFHIGHVDGRLLLDTNRSVTGIVEEADANSEQRKIDIVNVGIYCINKQFLIDSLALLDTRNEQHEMYLTDVVGIGYRHGKKIGALIAEDTCETIGINSQDDLKAAEIQMLRQTKS